MLSSLVCFLLTVILPVSSFIPASPSNQSITPSTLANDSSWIIQLNWLPIGVFSDGINHHLSSDSSDASIYQGVLLHFSEFNATTQPPASVPWIAMINCDSNSSVSSTQDDIFTLARDRGASAAMLYSSTSHSCSVNQDYIQNFGKPLNVFSAGSLQGARLIESQFSNVLRAGYWFQSDLLNASASTILQQIKSLGLSNLTANPKSTITLSTAQPLQTSANPTQSDSRSFSSESSDDQPLTRRSPIHDSSSRSSLQQSLIARSHPSPDQSIHLKLNLNSSAHHSTNPNARDNPVFLIATLANADVIGSLDPQRQSRNQNSNFQSNPSSGNNGSNTGLAMIILYAITGCVSFMFLIVIVSGAIRAIRNPDRYGPRPGGQVDPQTGEEDPYAQPRQTRAEGLGKAILDTFPIVKFGRQNTSSANKEDPELAKNNSATTKELKLQSDENTMLHPDRENIMMSERGQALEQPATTRSCIPVTTTTNTNNTPSVDQQPNQSSTQFDDDDEIGSVTSEAGPYPLLVSQIPLLSRPHLSLSPTKSINNSSKSESKMTLNTNQSSTKDQDDGVEDEAPSKTLNISIPNNGYKDDGLITATANMVIPNSSTTCPICVSEFQDDDDIRMLPCDARHQFHKECVDPWLLNESRFCPLCRWDLSTRKDGSKIETEVLESEMEVEPISPAVNQERETEEEAEEGALNPRRGESSSHEQTRNRIKIRPNWLSLRNRNSSSPLTTTETTTATTGPELPVVGSSTRPHIPFSIIPHIRRRARDQNDTIHQSAAGSNDRESHLQISSSSTTHNTNFNSNTNIQAHTNNSNNQESIDSHNRFLKYINQIRHNKK